MILVVEAGTTRVDVVVVVVNSSVGVVVVITLRRNETKGQKKCQNVSRFLVGEREKSNSRINLAGLNFSILGNTSG